MKSYSAILEMNLLCVFELPSPMLITTLRGVTGYGWWNDSFMARKRYLKVRNEYYRPQLVIYINIQFLYHNGIIFKSVLYTLSRNCTYIHYVRYIYFYFVLSRAYSSYRCSSYTVYFQGNPTINYLTCKFACLKVR